MSTSTSSSGSTCECDRCSFCCTSNEQLVKHTFEAHSADPRFTYPCPIGSCPHVFKLGSTYSSFRSHASRKHHDWKNVLMSFQPPTRSEDSTTTCAGGVFQGAAAPESDASESFLPGLPSTSAEESGLSPVSKSAAQFLLTLKERYCITQTAVNFAVGSVNQMVAHVCKELHDSVVETLQENEIAIPPALDDCFTPVEPFGGLATEYQQTKYYRENFGLVEPVTVVLGSSYCYQRSGTKARLVEKKDTFQYIPLIENLQAFLENKEVFDEVKKTHARSDGCLEDFCDGTLFKSHELFSRNPLALQLITYYDDVEVCNPLGSYRGVHKLALFYYVLGNLHPRLRSTLRSIQMIAVVTSSNLAKYGFEKVLQPFIRDANILSKGVHITIQGQDTLVEGAVYLMLADTLAAHSIGGFKVGVGFALRKCRDCMATAETMTTKFREQDFRLRTPDIYDYHCSLLSGPLASSDSTTYGLNSRSALNDLEYFHVANNQLPQDVMHVVLEGVIPYELRLMLNVFITDKRYFTLDLLNERIRCYPYTQEEIADKPSQISRAVLSSSHSLSQSAAQMWTLSIYLPLIIGNRVPLEDPLWECFLLLIDILKIVTARVLSPGLAAYLAALVHEHHGMFRRCYPAASITPKLHYMVHFPSQILKLGPLVTSWCMRMEAKNSYFKKIAHISSFKNIAFTMAKRHQRLMCAYLHSDNFFSTTAEYGPAADPSLLSSEASREEMKAVIPGVPDSCPVYRPKWIRYQGKVYRPTQFVLIGWQDDDLPRFGKIKDLLLAQNVAMLAVLQYDTSGIDHHYHSYLICSTHHECIIPLTHLDQSHSPVNVKAIASGVYLTLRYHITTT